MAAGDPKSQLGFTLIELLVTVALLAIIATVAVPAFKSMIERNRITAEYNHILVGLHYARSEAVKRRGVVRANISHDLDGWVMDIVFDGDTLRVFSSSSGDVVVNGGDEGAVEFNALGRRVPDSCTFDSCIISVADKEIEINAAGNVMRPQS